MIYTVYHPSTKMSRTCMSFFSENLFALSWRISHCNFQLRLQFLTAPGISNWDQHWWGKKKIVSCTHRNLAWKRQNPLKQLDAYQKEFEELEWNKWGNRSIRVFHTALHHSTHSCPLCLSRQLLSFFFSQCYPIRRNSVALKWIVSYQLMKFPHGFLWFGDHFGVISVSRSCFPRSWMEDGD